MSIYKGVIIEESLEDNSIIEKLKILSTKIEKVIDKHQTPWLLQWTLHTVEIPESKIDKVAKIISKSLDRGHGGSWYADFKNDSYHYIIFRNKLFKVNRKNKDQYEDAKNYGLSLGIPEYQLINYQGEAPDTL